MSAQSLAISELRVRTVHHMFARLPIELLQEVLAFALCEHPRPSDVLAVNSTFLQLGQPLLHAHLRFRSITQLRSFAEGAAPLECLPRSLTITLAGGATDFEVFKHLSDALRRCQTSIRASTRPDTHAGPLGRPDTRAEDQDGHPPPATELATESYPQVDLELLSLRLHSHSRNPHLSYIYGALSLANPKVFIWQGPDPEHHFSTAIVPTATYHLARALSTWTAVEHITLTNLSFPSDELGWHTPFSRDAPLLPPLRALRTLYIGQATLLPPTAVAAMLARPGMDALERVRLVDTYRHSIWGPRIRLRDVEDAVLGLRYVREGGGKGEMVLERVRRVVRCEKKTERIMGGDNGDEQGLLI